METRTGTRNSKVQQRYAPSAWNYRQLFQQKQKRQSVGWSQQAMRTRTCFKNKAEDYLKLFGKSPGPAQSGKLRRPPIWCPNSLCVRVGWGGGTLWASSLLKVSWSRVCGVPLRGSCVYSRVLLPRVRQCGLHQQSTECAVRLSLMSKLFQCGRE